MIHLIKVCGQRVVYDTGAGKAHKLSPLAFKLIDTLEAPLTKECPSRLRYANAKYDSRDVTAAYDSIYALYEAGEIFTEGKDAPAVAPVAVDAVRADYTDADAVAKLLAMGDGAVALHTVKSGERFSETVLALANKGMKIIAVEISDEAKAAPEFVCGEYEKVLKALIKDEYSFRFLPFELGYIAADSGDAPCAGCWAKGICSGGLSGNECDIRRRQIECALALSAK